MHKLLGAKVLYLDIQGDSLYYSTYTLFITIPQMPSLSDGVGAADLSLYIFLLRVRSLLYIYVCIHVCVCV